MMYEVVIPRTAYHTSTVEAESAEEALDKALDLLPSLCAECAKDTELDELDAEGIEVTVLKERKETE